MEIKVLGTGCASCVRLYELVEEAARELGLTEPVIKVTDIKEILALGVISTPALVIDGYVKFAGMVPSKDEIKRYLQGEGTHGGCGCGCGGGDCCC